MLIIFASAISNNTNPWHRFFLLLVVPVVLVARQPIPPGLRFGPASSQIIRVTVSCKSSIGCGPLPVTVTTRIITFSIRDPYKPSFTTVTGRGATLKSSTLKAQLDFCCRKIQESLEMIRSIPLVMIGVMSSSQPTPTNIEKKGVGNHHPPAVPKKWPLDSTDVSWKYLESPIPWCVWRNGESEILFSDLAQDSLIWVVFSIRKHWKFGR